MIDGLMREKAELSSICAMKIHVFQCSHSLEMTRSVQHVEEVFELIDSLLTIRVTPTAHVRIVCRSVFISRCVHNCY